MPGGFWNEDKDATAKRMLADGAFAQSVADELGTTKQAVCARAYRQGYGDLLGPVGKHSGAWTPEEDDYLLRERSAGRTFRNIAEALGRTVSSTSGRHDNLVMREIYSGFEHDRPIANFNPLYDGELHYSDLTAELLGDPPIGRREIMQRLEV